MRSLLAARRVREIRQVRVLATAGAAGPGRRVALVVAGGEEGVDVAAVQDRRDRRVAGLRVEIADEHADRVRGARATSRRSAAWRPWQVFSVSSAWHGGGQRARSRTADRRCCSRGGSRPRRAGRRGALTRTHSAVRNGPARRARSSPSTGSVVRIDFAVDRRIVAADDLVRPPSRSPSPGRRSEIRASPGRPPRPPRPAGTSASLELAGEQLDPLGSLQRSLSAGHAMPCSRFCATTVTDSRVAAVDPAARRLLSLSQPVERHREQQHRQHDRRPPSHAGDGTCSSAGVRSALVFGRRRPTSPGSCLGRRSR